MTDPACKRVFRLLAVASAFAASVSCTVGPEYLRPPADVPAAYKEAGAATVSAPRSAMAAGNWWELFGDADLNALAAAADVNNQTIRAAEARVR